MKKLFFITLAFIAMASCNACEICGCSSGNYFIGPFPVFQRHFVGVRYSFRNFKTILKNDQSQFSKDFYQTAEIWGGFNIGKKFQLLTFIPYNINRQNSDDGVKTNSGLGDVSLILNYNIFRTSHFDKNFVKADHELWIGGGLKMPTGKFDADANALVPSANNQVGTGSIDYILTTSYSMRKKQFGLNSNVTYKINESAKQFKFGNRLAANAFGSYSFGKKSVTFSPNAGLLFEKLWANKLSKVSVQDTGGEAFSGAAGLEMSFNKMSVGFNLQAPISENISNNQTHTKLNGMVHLTFIL